MESLTTDQASENSKYYSSVHYLRPCFTQKLKTIIASLFSTLWLLVNKLEMNLPTWEKLRKNYPNKINLDKSFNQHD